MTGKSSANRLIAIHSISAWPVYADHLVLHFGRRCNSLMDSPRLSAEVRIERAKDHPCMVFSPVLMKAEKVAPVVRQQNPAFGHGERQNLSIRHGGISPSCVQGRQHIMPRRRNSVTTCAAMFSFE